MIRRSVSCRPILLGLLTASVVGSLAARAGGQVVIPTCRLAQELRAAFGFGPQALAGLGVNSAAFSQIAAVATSHCEQNRPALEPLLEAVRAARADLFRAFESFDHEAAGFSAINASLAFLLITAAAAGLQWACAVVHARSHRILLGTLVLAALFADGHPYARAAMGLSREPDIRAQPPARHDLGKRGGSAPKLFVQSARRTKALAAHLPTLCLASSIITDKPKPQPAVRKIGIVEDSA